MPHVAQLWLLPWQLQRLLEDLEGWQSPLPPKSCHIVFRPQHLWHHFSTKAAFISLQAACNDLCLSPLRIVTKLSFTMFLLIFSSTKCQEFCLISLAFRRAVEFQLLSFTLPGGFHRHNFNSLVHRERGGGWWWANLVPAANVLSS